jgi:hypothetical protein
MLYIKQRDGKGKISVEMWDKGRKEWVIKERVYQ